jgi:hypothetical protein
MFKFGTPFQHNDEYHLALEILLRIEQAIMGFPNIVRQSFYLLKYMIQRNHLSLIKLSALSLFVKFVKLFDIKFMELSL